MVLGIYVLVFTGLSIAYRGVQTSEVNLAFGDRWYAVIIFAYVLLVRQFDVIVF